MSTEHIYRNPFPFLPPDLGANPVLCVALERQTLSTDYRSSAFTR